MVREPGVKVLMLAMNDPAGAGAASGGSDLLIVGARSLGALRGLRLGSVAQQIVRHDACPVVVVPRGGLASAAQQPLFPWSDQLGPGMSAGILMNDRNQSELANGSADNYGDFVRF